MTSEEIQGAMSIKTREQEKDIQRLKQRRRRERIIRRVEQLKKLCKPLEIRLTPVYPMQSRLNPEQDRPDDRSDGYSDDMIQEDISPLTQPSPSWENLVDDFLTPLSASTPLHDLTFLEFDTLPGDMFRSQPDLGMTTVLDVLSNFGMHNLSSSTLTGQAPHDQPQYSDISDASPEEDYPILPPPTPFRDPISDITDLDPTVTTRDWENIVEFGAWEAAQMAKLAKEEQGHHLSSHQQEMLRFKFEVVQETVRFCSNVEG